jgi:hypothetical protein
VPDSTGGGEEDMREERETRARREERETGAVCQCRTVLKGEKIGERRGRPAVPVPDSANVRVNPNKPEHWCRRFETGGSLGRRVSVAACPSPDGSSARASAKG